MLFYLLAIGKNSLILPPRIETRARLVRIQIAVADDEGLRIETFQDEEQIAQAGTLGRRACVGRLALLVQAAFVADADGTTVEAFCVCTLFAEQARVVECTVAADIEVVACSAETAGAVVAFQLFGCVDLAGTSGGTVDDEETHTVDGVAQQLLFAFQKGMIVVDKIPRQTCCRGKWMQFGCFHWLMQDWMPRAPSRAVTAGAATTFRTMFHTFVFLLFSFSGMVKNEG